MDERLVRLLARQQALGFEDVQGAQASLTLPLSERLLNELIAEGVPRGTLLREVHVSPQPGDRFAVQARVGASAWLPPITIQLAIDRQPEFPASPVLVLRMATTGLLSLAGPALRLLDVLPSGVRVEQDRVYVDVARLLQTRGLGAYLPFIDDLRVNTTAGAVLIALRTSIKGSSGAV